MHNKNSLVPSLFSFGMYNTPYKVSHLGQIYEFSPVYWYKDKLTLEKKLHFTLIYNNEAFVLEIIFWNEKFQNSKELFEIFKSDWIKPTIKSLGDKYEIRIITLIEYIKYKERLIKES